MPQSKRTLNEVVTLQCREGGGGDGSCNSDDDGKDGTWEESLVAGMVVDGWVDQDGVRLLNVHIILFCFEFCNSCQY